MRITTVIQMLFYLSIFTFILTSVGHNSTTIQACINVDGGYDICLRKYNISSQFNQETDNSSQKYHPCFCAVGCHFVGNWCPDIYLSSCVQTEYNVGEPNRKNRDKFAMVSFCPTQNKNASRKSCLLPIDQNNIWHQVPVISRHTNITYASKQCSECHGENDTIPWSTGVSCPRVLDLNTYSANSAFWEDLKQQKCSIYFTPPRNINPIPCNLSLTTTHTMTGKRKDSENIEIRNQYGYYRHVFCDLCITETKRNKELNLSQFEENILHGNCSMYTCIQTDRRLRISVNKDEGILHRNKSADSETVLSVEHRNCLIYAGCTFPWNVTKGRASDYSSHYVQQVNITSLFNECLESKYKTGCEKYSNSIQTNVLYSHSYRELFSVFDMSAEKNGRFSLECKLTEVYDPYQKKCRKLLCVPGKTLQGSSCQHFITHAQNVAYNIAFEVLMDSRTSNQTSCIIFDILKDVIQEEIFEGNVNFTAIYYHRIPEANILLQNIMNVYIKLKISNDTNPIHRKLLELHLLNLTRLTVDYKGFYFRFQENVESWCLPSQENELSSKLNCSDQTFTPGDNRTYAFDVTNLLFCTQIELKPEEFNFLRNNQQISVNAVNRKFDTTQFSINENGSVQICAETYILHKREPSAMTKASYIVSVACTIVSLLSLSLTFLTFCLFSVLRSIPGKNVMCFTFSLFFAQLLFLLRSEAKDKITCALVGALTHYFWISVFTCSNISCFHMFKSFVRNLHFHNEKSYEKKLLVKYIVISYILPTVPVTINVILHFMLSNSSEFGYGGDGHFLSSPLALIFTFILPIILQIVFNVIMFSVTFYSIKTTPTVKDQRRRNEFFIFFKLFLLTGISWVLLVIDGFFQLSPFTFLAIFLNGSQGVFLFFAYVCNRNVISFYRGILNLRVERDSD